MDLKVMVFFFWSSHLLLLFFFFFFGLRVKSYYLFVLSVCLSVCVSGDDDPAYDTQNFYECFL